MRILNDLLLKNDKLLGLNRPIERSASLDGFFAIKYPGKGNSFLREMRLKIQLALKSEVYLVFKVVEQCRRPGGEWSGILFQQQFGTQYSRFQTF